MELKVRPIEAADLQAIWTLNNQHARELGHTGLEEMRGFIATSVLATAIGRVAAPDAFLLAFDQDTPPQGPNHAWFLARHRRFLYVDRVCVAAPARKRGLARALYADAFAEAARHGAPVICCEVSSDPRNPVSDQFHAALGFAVVGSALLPERQKTVRYLEKVILIANRP